MDEGEKQVPREGSTEAPERRPLDWRGADFYDEQSLTKEMERVFEICHGCRRCFNLCNAFPTLFDAIDESDSGEIDGIGRPVYWKVVDHCYLCDLCFQTKCPYVPPHAFDVDFPHLMLRAKAVKGKAGRHSIRDRTLTATDAIGKLAAIPVVAETVNWANRNRAIRSVMERTVGIHRAAPLPPYASRTLRRRLKGAAAAAEAVPTPATRGRVVLFSTCYGNFNEPHIGEDLAAVYAHNEIPMTLTGRERCCGMPKLELGDLPAVEKLKDANIPELARWVAEGWDLTAPVPSCVLMFKKELPLLFPDDEQVAAVAAAMYDPFEYLMLRHRDGKLKVDFKRPLGKIAYHVPCHLRVQNIGLKTRDLLALVPDTEIEVTERCSGHDGTYAVKREFHETAVKIGRPVVSRIAQSQCDHFASDCPMAGNHIGYGLGEQRKPEHPMSLLRLAYGL